MPDPTYQPPIHIQNPFAAQTRTCTGDHWDDEDLQAKLDDISRRLEKLESGARPSIIVRPTVQEVRFYGARNFCKLSML